MRLSKFIEALQEFEKESPNLRVELTKTLAIDQEKGEAFEIRLDFPIIGLAENDGDLLLVTEADPGLLEFGKVNKLVRGCLSCGADGQITTTDEKEEILYGHQNTVKIPCVVPTHRCGACGFIFTDHVAEGIRDKAIKEYFAEKKKT